MDSGKTLPRKEFDFIGPSDREMRAMPHAIQDQFGRALLDAQYGDRPHGARPFGEGLPAKVMKLSDDLAGDTYRAAYTAEFAQCVYLLHVFQKKSKSGRATPRSTIELIRRRYRTACVRHQQQYPEAPDE